MNLYKFLIIILLSISSIHINSYSLENKIILKIDNNIITSQDIKNENKYLIALNPNISELDKKRVYAISKNSIIREKIKEIELLKNTNEIKLDDKFLNQIIQSRYQILGYSSLDEFIAYLKQKNITIETVKKKISIEAVWNQFIYSKYSNKIKINKDSLKKKILLDKEKALSKQFLLYEIVFDTTQGSNPIDKFKIIEQSINKIGFENTAATYSISDTAKIGGKLGWIEENSLSNKIKNKVSNLKLNEYTKPIIIPGGFLVIQLADKKQIKREINVNKEIDKAINFETNRQLNQFSNIYFNKVKKELVINEY